MTCGLSLCIASHWGGMIYKLKIEMIAVAQEVNDEDKTLELNN